MTDTSDTYIAKVLRASPFANNDAGIPQMCELIRALQAERNELKLEIQGLHEDAAGADI